MKHSPDEIVQALNVIKDVCEEHINITCLDCPFYANTCKVVDDKIAPCQWRVVKADPVIWRALK